MRSLPLGKVRLIPWRLLQTLIGTLEEPPAGVREGGIHSHENRCEVIDFSNFEKLQTGRDGISRGSLGKVCSRQVRHGCIGCRIRPSPVVGRVVVHDNVDLEVGRHAGRDVIQELAELRAAVAPATLSDDLACGDVKGCEQRGGAARPGRAAAAAAVGCDPGPEPATFRPRKEPWRAAAGPRRARRCRASCPRSTGLPRV